MSIRSSSIYAATAAAVAFGSSVFGQGQGILNSPAGWEAHPPLHVRPNVSTAPVGYVPTQIKHAYGLDMLANGGTGQTIAIVDAYGSPTAQNDLNVFSTQFGLPQTSILTVYGGKKPGRSDSGWALETSLDLQWAHALAPNARIILAVASSASISDLMLAVDAAVNAGATVVSMSWGGSEFSSEASYDYHFQKPGVSFLVSSGDNGAGASWPATSPSVVSVGGTSLYFNANGTVSETAWSGSGGGFSGYFSRPTYQDGWQSNAKRAFPDVSLVADPNTGVAVYDSAGYHGQKGWFQIGGTSASAPMWSAIIALANEARQASGGPTLTGSTASLYSLATVSYASYFIDIISGGNGGFTATPGYDEVTGLGTPIGPNVVLNLGK